MKFNSLRIDAKGIGGLETEELKFGEHITQLHGPTGTGKTPIIKSIAYCLGGEVTFRQEIYDKCHSATLTFVSNEVEYIAKRDYLKGNDFSVELTSPDGLKERFYDQRSYSDFLFEIIGVDQRSLISKGNEKVSPYMSTVLPLFYVTQDGGYGSVYNSASNFIVSQFSEMVRFSFGLSEKNSFNKKKKKQDAKSKLEVLDDVVVKKKQRLAVIKDAVVSERPSKEIESDIQSLEEGLRVLIDGASEQSSVYEVLDRNISQNRNSRRKVLNELNIIKNRRIGLEEIRNEIYTEVNTLSLNEEARRIFSEVCTSSNCGLFSVSSEAFSKNLLYLKDQIKDLEANDENDALAQVRLEKQLSEFDELIEQQESDREAAVQDLGIEYQLEAVSNLKTQLFKLQSELLETQRVENAEREYFDSITSRDRAYDDYESYSTGGRVDLRVAEFRHELSSKVVEWLETLKTSNVSYSIGFREDFEPTFGEETVKHLSGSTGSRAVLAFHAALFDLAVVRSPFKFLVLDAPKQHETENVDLDRYVKKLKGLCEQFGVQVVFSATEYEYDGDENDAQWQPRYLINDKAMFMREHA